jgi:hypothetical protein
MQQCMPGWHIPNWAVAALLLVAVLGFMGPHLLILGFQAAGSPPPSALVFLCPIHRVHGQPGQVSVRRNLTPVHIGDLRPGSSPSPAASMAS